MPSARPRSRFARPLEAGGRRADDEVISAVLADTNGYPFRIQFVGALLWDAVPTLPTISLRDFQRQRPTILRALDHAFFDAAWQRPQAWSAGYCTPSLVRARTHQSIPFSSC